MPTLLQFHERAEFLSTLRKSLTYNGVGIQRAQDYAGAVKLLEANQLPREFGVDAQVRTEYQKIWDGLDPASTH